MENKPFFKKAKNRFCVNIPGFGLIPVATDGDDIPLFVVGTPKRIGDEAIIIAEGKRRRVMLLKSEGHVKNSTYLVDMGQAR